jgi:hypothetical protein
VTKRDKKKGRNRISRTTKSMRRKTIKRNMKDDEIEEKRHEE